MIDLRDVVRDSELPGADGLPRARPSNWHETFKLLSTAIPDDSPSILVIDEVPWLIEQDRLLEGVLQTEWDRRLRKKPVLLLLVGSDLHMMKTFLGYDRPFYGRATSMTVLPLNPAETATITGLSGSDALDAHLITGGFPGLCRTWAPGLTAAEYVADQCEFAETRCSPWARR
ncbi:AAA family ATPase [Glycomyces tenuis]|uniref:AAA family ATPase n=1 Tax=Glycomyces tenuis TaxID=58116 RepID=UPI0003F94CC2|nr:hypothetical protein [Glycomyces tenuis]